MTDKQSVSEDFIFTEVGTLCPVCKIFSFPHIHRKGTLPKDFERIEQSVSPSSWEEVEKEFDQRFQFVPVYLKEGHIWDMKLDKSYLDFLELKNFFKTKISDAEKRGYERGRKEGMSIGLRMAKQEIKKKQKEIKITFNKKGKKMWENNFTQQNK